MKTYIVKNTSDQFYAYLEDTTIPYKMDMEKGQTTLKLTGPDQFLEMGIEFCKYQHEGIMNEMRDMIFKVFGAVPFNDTEIWEDAEAAKYMADLGKEMLQLVSKLNDREEIAKKEIRTEAASHTEWEQDVTRALEDIAEVSTSDAQGIMECQEFILTQCWGKALSPIETAALINTASLKV